MLAVACASVVQGQTVEPVPDSTQTLAGPAVQEHTGPPSLVKFDYQGSLRRYGGEGAIGPATLEDAAISLLTLSEPESQAIEAIRARRAAAFDALVRKELDTLIELQSAGGAGRQQDVGRLLLKLWNASDEIRKPGPLRTQYEQALQQANRRVFSRAIDEYIDAAHAESRRSPAEPSAMMEAMDREGDAAPAQPEGKRRFQIVLEERFRGLQAELERAVQRVIGDRRGEQEFEAMLASLELKPDQESRIRAQVQDFILQTKFNPTERDLIKLIAQIGAYLDESQRDRLADWISEQDRQRREADRPMKQERPQDRREPMSAPTRR